MKKEKTSGLLIILQITGLQKQLAITMKIAGDTKKSRCGNSADKT